MATEDYGMDYKSMSSCLKSLNDSPGKGQSNSPVYKGSRGANPAAKGSTSAMKKPKKGGS